MVQSHSGPDGQTRWEKPRAQLLANLARWKQQRDSAAAAGDPVTGGSGAGGGGGDGGDFWEMSSKVRLL